MRGLSTAWLCVLGVVLLTVACVGTTEEGGEEVEVEVEVVDEPEGVQYDGPPVINTTTGLISGIEETSTNGNTFYSYYGIPYAKPPVGLLRFKDPEKVVPWEGVRDGSQQPPFCPQILPAALFTGHGDQSVVGQEDCLFLNVFTPKPDQKKAKLPIMIYIHGGAWLSGGAYEYPPHVLLNHEMVLVVLQYRLGFLGFMSTEDKVAPGNLGLKDQTLAMKWVQDNAEIFGGDPLKVTLFGQSAGAASVHFQILTYESIGLFRRAILESGTALCPWSLGKAHREVVEYTGKFFNCSIPEVQENENEQEQENEQEPEKEQEQEEEQQEGTRRKRGKGKKEKEKKKEEEKPDPASVALVECLQGVEANDLVPIFAHFTEWILSPLVFGPRVDGDYLFKHPAMLMKEARHKRVDLMTGISKDEGSFLSLPMFSNEAFRSSLMYNFPNVAPVALEFGLGDVAPVNQSIQIFHRYIGGKMLDETTADNITQLFTDRFFAIAHDETASIHAINVERQKKNVYQYELHHRGQHSHSDYFPLMFGDSYVSHNDELPYLFTGGPYWKPLEREEDLKLRDIITTMWYNFANSGDPTPDDSLGFKWEPVTKDNLKHLTLKPQPVMEEDYRNETREFWTSLPLHQNFILHSDKIQNLVYKEEGEEEKKEGETEGEEGEKEVEEKGGKDMKKERVEEKSQKKKEGGKKVEEEVKGKKEGKKEGKQEKKQDKRKVEEEKKQGEKETKKNEKKNKEKENRKEGEKKEGKQQKEEKKYKEEKKKDGKKEKKEDRKTKDDKKNKKSKDEL